MMDTELLELLSKHTQIRDALSEEAMLVLENARVDRAKEVLEDLIGKEDVRNPSGFLVSALRKFPLKRKRPSDLEELLARHPEIDTALDVTARRKLFEIDAARGIEIIEQLAEKSGVRNISAYVTNTVDKFSYSFKRGSGKTGFEARAPLRPSRGRNHRERWSDVDMLLAQYPHIAAALDDSALHMLQKADTFRAIELLEDVANKGDIADVSRFIVKALTVYPSHRVLNKKGKWAAAAKYEGGVFIAAEAGVESLLEEYADVEAALDDDSLRLLLSSDPFRAMELIEEVACLDGVDNVSAYVVKALKKHPQVRDWVSAYTAMQCAFFGSEILDDYAVQMLYEAGPDDAVMTLVDLASNVDYIRNPSAFVARALQFHHPKRRRADW